MILRQQQSSFSHFRLQCHVIPTYIGGCILEYILYTRDNTTTMQLRVFNPIIAMVT